MTRPRLLILSLSPIAADARVLKQVEEFAADYEVTTCGYGPSPAGVAEHREVPAEAVLWRWPKLTTVLRRYRVAYARNPALAAARAALRGAPRFDVVLANDVEAVGLALELAPTGGIHADLHEFAPRVHEEAWKFRLFIRPLVRWMCRTQVTRADSWSTVSSGLAREYHREFGITPVVVTNATPYRDAAPTPPGRPLRLVHSGACLRNRALHTYIEAVSLATESVVMDLFLTPNDPAYLEELRAAAADTDGRVQVRDPLPYAELVERLGNYDVGISVIPPTNFNLRWSLPNKLFDFVQARLAVVVGPSPEMAAVVEENGIGVVTAGFGAADLAAALDGLTPERVAACKAASDASAHALSAESQVAIWRAAVDALARRG